MSVVIGVLRSTVTSGVKSDTSKAYRTNRSFRSTRLLFFHHPPIG